jgi:iron complex transport system permease protein
MKERMRGSMVTLILAGLVISSLFSALISLVKYTADPQDVLPVITFWLMGRFSSVTASQFLTAAPFILAGILIIFLFRNRLNAVSLSEEEARSLGVRIKPARMILILASSMITASVVSTCGVIGWVGLLIPHIARMLLGNDNRRVVPASIIMGGLFLLIMDTIARCATASEIPVSILTAILGAPMFILILRKTGGIHS